MEIILLEKIANLGELGDKVEVKPGYARNYLIPQGKAQVANKENLIAFEKRKEELKKLEQERLNVAQQRADQINGREIIIYHQAGEEGKLFGSVTSHEITETISKELTEVEKSEVRMPDGPIRAVGEYKIQVSLHTDIIATIDVVVKPLENDN